MTNPEARARQEIDRLLTAAGWLVQDRDQFNRNAGLGVAVRELPLKGSEEADYGLFVAGRAAGVVEAKPQGVTLSGVAEQSEGYTRKLREDVVRWGDPPAPLPFAYESTGVETFFRDNRDPKPRSRRLFAFHRPEILHEWLQQPNTLRARLRRLPVLIEIGLRQCQIEAVQGLDRSLAGDHPRALIQMATGAGKTYTACNFLYRLIKHGGAHRVLFLVDRANLGRQTLNELQQFRPADDGRTFTSLYNVQALTSNRLDKDAKLVITTIQRLYSMLRGETVYDEEQEEHSSFEDPEAGPDRTVEYNPALPIETFDFIVVDECHRSIYKTWRQVLEYFDAYLIGLTATPSAQTMGFFGNNLVSEYPYERSVVDGVNVGYEIYRIKTQVSERGSKVDAGYQVALRDRQTRRVRWETLDQDLVYTAKELDRSVVAKDQIRTILETFRARLFTELFPGRDTVPKTLVFAKDDAHAEEIVHIAREVFEEGNEFCKKITYRTTGETPESLLKRFRNDFHPRIAVTVDMIATGTDVRPLEIVMFMRDVRSSLYYEQMKGRGSRTLPPSELISVTPDAKAKSHFVLIDAVGVTESVKSDTQPLERNRSVPFDKLLERLAGGNPDEATLSSAAARLAALDREIEPRDAEAIRLAAGGRTLGQLATALLDAIDPDRIEEEATARFGHKDEKAEDDAAAALKEVACAPFSDPELRKLLVSIKARAEMIIDEVTKDRVTGAGYDVDRAKEIVRKFEEFIAENRDRLTALEIILGKPYGQRRLTYDMIAELSDALERPPTLLTTANVWQAYRRLEQAKVRGTTDPAKLLTNIVALVRFASGLDPALESFDVGVTQRFNLWLGRQKKAGKEFTAEQMEWLVRIRDHIAANIEVTRRDLIEAQHFAARGGFTKARSLFGKSLEPVLEELNGALVA